jgi:hypothetical protein
MKRLWRIILNGLTVLSLLLCVATVGLWVRSYWIADAWVWSVGYKDSDLNFWAWSACSNRGGLSLSTCFHTHGHGVFSGRGSGIPPGRRLRWLRLPSSDSAYYLGYPYDTVGRRFGIVSNHSEDGWGYVDLLKGFAMPWPAITVLCAIPPSVRGLLWLIRCPRVRPGHCRTCGYDLRATPDRCPECGAVPDKVKA